MTKKRFRKLPFASCMQQEVAVYSEYSILIGTGWIFVTASGQPLAPMLRDRYGNCLLEKGWYNLVATGEPQLVVIARSVQ